MEVAFIERDGDGRDSRCECNRFLMECTNCHIEFGIAELLAVVSCFFIRLNSLSDSNHPHPHKNGNERKTNTAVYYS